MVWIPADCETIGDYAFAGSGIAFAHIAGMDTTIGDRAFPACTVIFAPTGSAAQAWAEDEENGCTFVAEP